MMQKLEKLIDVLLETAVEVRAHYAYQNRSQLPLGSAPKEVAPDARPKKEKVKKEAVKEENPLADLEFGMDGEAETNGKVELTEAQAQAEVMRLTRMFVKKYETEEPNGVERARLLLKKHFNLSKLPELTHAHRIKFIGILEKELV